MALNEAERGAGGSAPVRLGDSYEIFPHRPLADLAGPSAAAFVAASRDRAADSLYALICDPALQPRRATIEALSGLHADAIVTPLAWGVVDWLPAQRRSYAIVFARPGGERLVGAMSQRIAPLAADVAAHVVLPGLVGSLRTLFSTGHSHRAIRPTNLFLRAPASPQLMLGECVSGPPGMGQPAFCETIESALASPAGRGDGMPGDDLYALGATLLFLLLGGCPAAELPDDELVAEKMNRGSYTALLGAGRLSSNLSEPVRGLLADDPRERWSLQDIELWVQGRRLAPRQYSFAKRAARPFEFVGEGYFTARTLAHGFARNRSLAVSAIRSQEFDAWLQRSLCDQDLNAALKTAFSEAHDAGLAGSQEERLVARVCMALDPLAPIRYDGFAATVEGFGTALAAAARGRGSVNTVAQALAGRLPQFWFSVQATLRPEHIPRLKAFERLRLYLDDRRPGFGIERVLYELDANVHCLSPAVETENVTDVGELLPTLERVTAAGRLEEMTIDRHLAAFIAARYKGAGGDWIEPLASTEAAERSLGALLILARLQAWRGPNAVPALCQRLTRQMPPVIERYHSRPLRARLLADLPKRAAKGDLADLLMLVDDESERRADHLAFLAARREYQSLVRALDVLQDDAPDRPAHAAQLGGRLAVGVSTFLAWAAAMATVVIAG